MNKVLVLLSSYNGERYIREQIESILNQKDVDTRILIRDDGSKDGTVDILHSIEKKYSNVNVLYGDNVGTISSFNRLVENSDCDGYEYMAFSDQDDVWLSDKLKEASNRLAEYSDRPALYCSNLCVVDSDMKEIGPMRVKEPQISLGTAVVENIAVGCTSVFNQKARQLYLKGISGRMEMHDFWMYLCCVTQGKVIYDNIPRIKYRQHEQNQVGARKKSVGTFVRNLYDQPKNIRLTMLKEFRNHYYEALDPDSRELLDCAAKYNDSLFNRIKLITNKKISCSDEKLLTAFKIRALLGRM